MALSVAVFESDFGVANDLDEPRQSTSVWTPFIVPATPDGARIDS
jgi:hypothetical protein